MIGTGLARLRILAIGKKWDHETDEKLTLLLQKVTMTGPARTLEKALERDLLKVEQHHRITLLDIIFGEAQGYPFNLDKTRIPRRWKCSHWACPMQR